LHDRFDYQPLKKAPAHAGSEAVLLPGWEGRVPAATIPASNCFSFLFVTPNAIAEIAQGE
jgi:hypothetical protein